MDVAAGILREVPAPVVVGDAAHLPFRSQVGDVVLAMHMLYHVQDIPAALAEMVRVLRPGGVLIASTNARDDKAELDELWAADVLGVVDPPRRVSLSARFALDDAGEVLAGHLDAVELIELPGVIAVGDPEPVVAHLASYRAWADQLGVPFDATVARVRTLLDRRLAQEGEFRIRGRGGILIGHAPVAVPLLGGAAGGRHAARGPRRRRRVGAGRAAVGATADRDRGRAAAGVALAGRGDGGDDPAAGVDPRGMPDLLDAGTPLNHVDRAPGEATLRVARVTKPA